MHILCFSAFSALQVERKFEFSCSYFPPSHRRRALACHTNACSAWEKKHVRFENLCSGIFHLLVAFKWWKSVAGEGARWASEKKSRKSFHEILYFPLSSLSLSLFWPKHRNRWRDLSKSTRQSALESAELKRMEKTFSRRKAKSP